MNFNSRMDKNKNKNKIKPFVVSTRHYSYAVCTYAAIDKASMLMFSWLNVYHVQYVSKACKHANIC